MSLESPPIESPSIKKSEPPSSPSSFDVESPPPANFKSLSPPPSNEDPSHENPPKGLSTSPPSSKVESFSPPPSTNTTLSSPPPYPSQNSRPTSSPSPQGSSSHHSTSKNQGL
ncbi:hypothetical protein KP509_01G084400 [Ceratopteris richardii]|nr:hypothetical protein KP509_01G084400 [Ceratopteris richardii]